MVCNPPYGEGSVKEQVEELYRSLGQLDARLTAGPCSYSLRILSSRVLSGGPTENAWRQDQVLLQYLVRCLVAR
jgi:hypothetical protein